MVTIENYEEYLMMAADGELSASEQAALNAFLKAHPELAEEAATWESVRLQPDETIVFVDKEALLKHEPKRIVIRWRPYALAAAAAVAGIAILLPMLWNKDNDHHFASISHHFTLPATVAVRDTAVSVSPTIPSYVATKKAVANTTTQPSVQALQPETPLLPPSIRPSEDLLVAQARPPMQPMPLPEMSLTLPAYPARESASIQVHLAVANQPVVELLREGMEQRVTQLASAAQSIRNTDLIVKIGNSSIKLN